MHRQAAGFVVLLLAVLTIAIMKGFVAAPAAGLAVRSPPPAAPTVGACGDLSGPEFVQVDCAQNHSMEVAFAWAAGDAGADPQPSFAVCTDKVRRYVGSAPAQDPTAHRIGAWSLPLRYRQVIVTGPNGVDLEEWSWQACLVVPMGSATADGYQGRVRSVPATGPASSALRACYNKSAPAITVTPCSNPHLGEIIGTQPLPLATDVNSIALSDELNTSCTAEVGEIMGAADPTFGGQLRVAVLSDRGSQSTGPWSADIGVYYTSDGLGWLVCAVESAGGRKLLDSVAGVGSGPLPFE